MRGTIPRYAVIPTHNRHDELTALVTQLSRQCDGIVIIDNASTPAVSSRTLYDETGWDVNITVIRDMEQPPNLSRLWNVGLDAVKIVCDLTGEDLWDVAIFNDDAVVPDDWWDGVSHYMREYNVTLASRRCYAKVTTDPKIKTKPDEIITDRLCGWAFMMRGETGLRADERFRWWYGDTDLDWQARQLNGMLLAPGEPVGNRYADQSTQGVLAEWATRDSVAFREKWGWLPWA